jgi:hypothetical protein
MLEYFYLTKFINIWPWGKQLSSNTVVLCFECGAKNSVPENAVGARCGKCKAALSVTARKTLKADKRYTPASGSPGKIKRHTSVITKMVRYAALILLVYGLYQGYLIFSDELGPSPVVQVSSPKAKLAATSAVQVITPKTKRIARPADQEIVSSTKLFVYSEDEISTLKEKFNKINFGDRKKIQIGLKVSGNYSRSIDGIWGLATENAIVRFGQYNKITFDSNNIFDQIIAASVSSKTGELWYLSPQKRQAPFAVEAASGSNYYVKLRYADSKVAILAAFIKGGETYTTKAPLGRFEFVYATGDRWLGEKKLFGPETGIYKTDKILVFKIDGNRIMGKKISLIKRPNGNLISLTLSKGSF